MASYENFYTGSDSYLMPKSVAAGYSLNSGELGMAIDARTANQLGDLALKINPGQKVTEIGAVQTAVFESIPIQHFDEMRRLLKLTGVKPSFHAPLVEPSGIGERGFDESTRYGAERQIQDAVLRAHQLDPTGNISVTLHSSAGLPDMTQKTKDKNGKDVIQSITLIDPLAGKTHTIRNEKTFFPEQGKFEPDKEQTFDPKKEVSRFNETLWIDRLSDVNRSANWGEREIDSGLRANLNDQEIDQATLAKDQQTILKFFKSGGDVNKLPEELREPYARRIKDLETGAIYMRDAYRNIKQLFDQAWVGAERNNDEEAKKRLKTFADEISPLVKEKNGLLIERDPERLLQLREAIEKGIKVLGAIKEPPKTFIPLDEYALDRTAKTFANVALSSYEKFKNSAPVLNIENPPAGEGFSRAEDLKRVVEESRKKLVEELKKKGMENSEAKKISEKMIGATWDVGHINMLRKMGYSEKDIVKQTEIIAPFVKHVHLSDNFGFEHTELPMGMGNVPMKEILSKLGEAGFEGKKIIEAGNWWQYFAQQGGGNPFKPSIENFDSPLFRAYAGPSWSQLGGMGNYYAGQGTINPSIHHSYYGAGFTSLPMDLGGNVAGSGDQSRFSNTPNQ
ncbi:MAG: sugar phosphate isomerase/epimerase family protein [Candidatus Nanoarchaeia archaeon]